MTLEQTLFNAYHSLRLSEVFTPFLSYISWDILLRIVFHSTVKLQKKKPDNCQYMYYDNLCNTCD